MEVEGNKGGSLVRIVETDREGIVHLTVGETCVYTIDQEISVFALAAILSRAKHIGFEKMLADYGVPTDVLWPEGKSEGKSDDSDFHGF